MSLDLLIVDAHERDRVGIVSFFERQGHRVTVTDDAREGQSLVRERFFPLVLVDVDVEPWGGLEFVTFVRGQSPRSEVALLTVRRSWDVAVGGYRRGAVEVVFKDQSDATRLTELVERAARRWAGDGAGAGSENLPAEAKQLLDEMLARMLDMSQHVPATQSRLETMPQGSVRVAVVDHEPRVHQAIAAAATASRGSAAAFEVSALPSGGAALDALSGAPPDVLVARDDLLDLPGTTLVAGLYERSPELLAVVYGAGPGGGAQATIYEEGHAVRTVRPLADPAPLVREVCTLVERAAASVARRRLMDLFRLEHSDLLRRYGVLRGRLDEEARARGGGG
ncbi:MAG: response regulator [Deltaproteobacteria bacterium]|nr:response regulator [Deltaproteobacteria bacterium]